MTAPDGSTWHVGRQWLPWRLKRRAPDADLGSWDIAGAGADDLIGILLAVVIGIVVIALLFTVIIPLVALAVEIILLIVLLVWGVGARLVLRRPWTIRAREQDGRRELVYKAKGFQRSGRVRDEVAEAIARGEATPRPAEALPA